MRYHVCGASGAFSRTASSSPAKGLSFAIRIIAPADTAASIGVRRFLHAQNDFEQWKLQGVCHKTQPDWEATGKQAASLHHYARVP
jgi:hypothetical protein